MRRASRLAVLAVASVVAALPGAPARAQAKKQPVYVGALACAECHEGRHAGNQYSHWLASAHARAWASLAKPEAREMARLSGITDVPEQSPICLGCHATAAETEAWERDASFRLEDGVQCEKCHGPGSEYMDADVMRDPEAAKRAGLRRFTKRDCAVCHYVKGSHVAVHNKPQLDVDLGWERLAHPIPEGGIAEPSEASLAGGAVAPSGAAGGGMAGPELTGTHACGACHRGPTMGYQYSLWRLSPHARAYAALATPLAAERAKAMGVTSDAQTSPVCLGCHATGGRDATPALETFSRMEGVGCESCHGPGSDYSPEAVMRDPVGSRQAGLREAAGSCGGCHEKAHGKPFDLEAALRAIAHPLPGRKAAAGGGHSPLGVNGGTSGASHGGGGAVGHRAGRDAIIGETARYRTEPMTPEARRAAVRASLQVTYKTPVNLAVRPDGREVWVACEGSSSAIVVSTASREKVAEIAVGGHPHDVAFSPDGTRAFVSNRLDDSVSVVDAALRTVVDTIGVGDEPHGLLTDRDGRTLYVANTSGDRISVIDLATGRERTRLAASRNPWSVALSPDGARLLVTNALSRFVPFRTPSMSEVTVLDAREGRVEDRWVIPEANLLMGVAWHPSGEFAIATLNRTKNLVPMTRLLQGWTISNGMAVLWKDGRVDQVLLDEPNLCFADATDVAFTPDGTTALVTSSGTDQVAVVDVEKLLSLLRRSTDEERLEVLPNHLGQALEFVTGYVPTRNSPRGIAVSPDGKTAWVTNALDDSLSVIDVARAAAGEPAAARIDLGGPGLVTHVRWGERLFHSADVAFQRQFSCHSCHPDGHVDGLTYDIEADGIGVSPVDNRTLRGIYDTDPFKWEGTNVSLARQCGPRLAVFFTRIQPFTEAELAALNDYTVTVPRPPNRYRPLGRELTEAQRRGKVIFERLYTNDGREIPVNNRCITCHFAPYYTDRTRRDVGTKQPSDRAGEFDVPHLNNIYDSAPYLHNGMADTLEEIWTRFNPYDRHGVTNDMTKDQLNDLIEYLKTL
jgi:YVTN family beta-propeller protein